MERNEISRHEFIVAQCLQRHTGRWLTNQEIGQEAPGVAFRTIRAHTRRFVEIGVVDQLEVFPAHRYRWSSKAEQRNRAFTLRLKQAAEVFN